MTKSSVSFSSILPIPRLTLKLLGLFKHLLTLGDEWRLNIRTMEPVLEERKGQDDRSLLKDNEKYETINYWFLRRILRILRPSKDDVFYDLGCGMGRVVCMVARQTVKKCVGVDFSRYYSDRARKNAGWLRGRKSTIEVRSEDAAATDVSDGTIYYMFNPFGPYTMGRVVGNIERSLAVNPRRITIVYANPVHRDLLESRPWLSLYHTYRTVGDLYVTFWKNNYPG